ncbi:cell cycle control protein-related [Ostreococcus tauri]|uniref:Cell cycle control protein-related n=1 Tax=Ostreococcus tauri TaxID=70448 RepID=A0A1Y5I6S8_OSTTA|nr:cell cycle control protein-related [Ostreococcus tauri]
MSTLAATKADGFYYPPVPLLTSALVSHSQDWTPEGGVKGSAFKGSNGSLGKRANKMRSHGVLTIRFEMPFHVKCGACEHTIAKGVRFNAEKKKIGMYHTTPIWSFTMRSPCCSQEIEVQTDPARTEYNVTKGAERCVGYGVVPEVESAEDAMHMLEYHTEEERAALSTNPMSSLERGVEDDRRKRGNSSCRSQYSLNRRSRQRVRRSA